MPGTDTPQVCTMLLVLLLLVLLLLLWLLLTLSFRLLQGRVAAITKLASCSRVQVHIAHK